ncbi:MAG: hypothetical protein OHK0046_12130 [Anaerolineae bacterium]
MGELPPPGLEAENRMLMSHDAVERAAAGFVRGWSTSRWTPDTSVLADTRVFIPQVD